MLGRLEPDNQAVTDDEKHLIFSSFQWVSCAAPEKRQLRSHFTLCKAELFGLNSLILAQNVKILALF